MSELYERTPVYCFTADVDWASESAIEIQQEIFDRHGIHATYFVTHGSPAVQRAYTAGRIDRGLHPNFLAGSSQGTSFEEVMTTVLQWAPEARTYRCHRYFDVSDVAHAYRARGFRYDANLCTNLQPGIAPIRHESGLIRFATFYEDGTHAWNRQSWRFDDVGPEFARPGIKIISVHPMITAMNVDSWEYWSKLKERFPPSAWIRVSPEELTECRRPGPGPQPFLEEMLQFVKHRGFPVMTLEELYRNFGAA